MRLVPLVSADFLQAASAAQTHQRRLQEAVPGLEVLGRLMMSRRGVAHLLLAAVLQGHDLEKPQKQRELLAARRHMKQQYLSSSYTLHLMCGAYVCPRTQDKCLMLTHCRQPETGTNNITIVQRTRRHAEYCRKVNYNM